MRDPIAQAAPPPPAGLPSAISGRYLLERELGQGGMGRVLLARDLRLERRVAIKIVAAESADPRQIQQLEREARTVASLRHPNILQVHDIGWSERGPFVVEEYLEGQSLRQLLASGPLPVAQAQALVAQAARGLEAAHARGVIHCDLKPDNLFVSSDGLLKILDFGIARLAGSLPAAAGARAAAGGPGGLATGTGASGFAGTPAYASPEQVRGAPLDARSDLFSLGVVCYEALAGTRPFSGATAVDVGLAVLQQAPPPLPERVPRPLQRLVAACLEKDPARRPQSAKELAAALEALGPARARGRQRVLAAAAIGAALLGGAALWLRPVPGPPVFHQISFLPGAVWSARFAAEGSGVLFTEAFDGPSPRVLSSGLRAGDPPRTEQQDAVLLGVSAAGELAILRRPAFRSFGFTGTLAVVRPGEAAPRELASGVTGADWVPGSGALALVRRVGSSERLELPAGNVLFETQGWISHLRAAPSGGRLAFLHHRDLADDAGDVMLLDGAGAARVLAGGWFSATGLAWSPDGSEIWFGANEPGDSDGAGSLRAVSLDGRQRRIARTTGPLEVQDVSRKGLVLATEPRRTLGIAADRRGEAVDLSVRDEQVLQDLSADGTLALFTINPRAPDGEGTLLVRRTDGSPPQELARGYGGAFAPDGRTALVFPSRGSPWPPALVVLGGDERRELRPFALTLYRARFLPDGKRVLLVGAEEGHGSRLLLFSLDDQRLVPVSDEGVSHSTLLISPDGRYAAATDLRGAIRLHPIAGGPALPLPEAAEGEVPCGFDAGGALLLGRPAGGGFDVDRFDLATRRRAPFRQLRPPAPGGALLQRVLFSAAGDIAAHQLVAWRTHLYLLDEPR